MRAFVHHLLLLLSFSILLLPVAPSGAAGFDFSPYGRLLESYLVENMSIEGIPTNVIDYRRMKEEQDRPGSDYARLLADLRSFVPSSLEEREDRLAFWINVYNIAAIKTILDHYPTKSIRSRAINLLGLPWKRTAIEVGGEAYSLHRIEFDVLVERFEDLRVHLGLNCASASCADLAPSPYRGEALDRQLDEQGRRLAAAKMKGLRIDREKKVVFVSKIFEFDAKHFDAWAGGAVAFLLPYVEDPEDRAFLRAGDFSLDYLDYSWTLNDLELVDRP